MHLLARDWKLLCECYIFFLSIWCRSRLRSRGFGSGIGFGSEATVCEWFGGLGLLRGGQGRSMYVSSCVMYACEVWRF